ncbi:uncharacterized protein A1O9_08279 [Exophiala aquamarina CBS 119918]|uniref:Stress response RCI peptide n=1 Tax=Exophiala aquamarina CBS 119918 TaxID=1182545 RepID=A0A072P5Z2_9EURO|nr:uncharacterized protein A1O9_08279 [Exophiala aquamarina CBS 119918]KEF55529.1 hypothetical protein A1O9_08279 [Exophiala aquamarina CBS 119918]
MSSRHGTSSTGNVCLYFLAIFIPPIAVLLRSGCGASFLINICLTILGWIPGIIHAWYVISRRERTVVVRTSKPVRQPIMGGGGVGVGGMHAHGHHGRPAMAQRRRRW